MTSVVAGVPASLGFSRFPVDLLLASRGAYCKAFWADPPSCAVGEPRSGYLGERSFPLILQNIHRDFLYLALGFIVILSYDAWKGFWFEDPTSLENGWLKRRVKNAIIAGFSE